MEHLKPGDSCLECLESGRDHKLRFFHISFEEQLLKCEARSCLWPHNDEVSSDEDFDLEAAPQVVLETAHSSADSAAAETFSSVNACDDDDEFILQLLQQLDPATEIKTDESLPELSASAPIELNSYPELELTGPTCLKQTIPDQKDPEKPVIAKLKTPGKLKMPIGLKTPLLKDLKAQLASKLKIAPEISAKLPEIPLQRASLKTSPRSNPQGNPFIFSPPKKASTQPRSPEPSTSQVTQPAINIVISIPKPNPFLDAIKRHTTEPTNTARSVTSRGGKRGRRPALVGRGRTQAVMQLFEHLESTSTLESRPSARLSDLEKQEFCVF